MNNTKLKELKYFATNCREDIIRMSALGGCFIGASLSCVDMIVYLYNEYFNIVDTGIASDHRDYFILSKGHDVPALYSVLARLNIIDFDRLKNHCKLNDQIYWHPNTSIPGIEFHSGSLGHGLSVGMGITYFHKINEMPNKTVVMIGDGEMNEGSIWEGLLVASAKKLNNLIVIVDRNEFQANLRTEELIPLEPIEDKLTSFGWNTKRINGHSFAEIDQAFKKIQDSPKPSVIIANTVRGKGLPSIEKDSTRWFVHFSQKEVVELIDELHGKKMASLTTEKQLVR